MKEEFKTVAKCTDVLSAEIIAGMLRSNGIPAQVFGQASSYPSINMAINAVEVKVKEHYTISVVHIDIRLCFHYRVINFFHHGVFVHSRDNVFVGRNVILRYVGELVNYLNIRQ